MTPQEKAKLKVEACKESQSVLGIGGFYGGGFNVLPRFTKEEHCYYKFTDRKKAEAVATLVEGSVEEV